MSQSASVTRWPCSWSHAARWTASVLLPTPPFEFATTIIMGRTVALHRRHVGKPFVKLAVEHDDWTA